MGVARGPRILPQEPRLPRPLGAEPSHSLTTHRLPQLLMRFALFFEPTLPGQGSSARAFQKSVFHLSQREINYSLRASLATPREPRTAPTRSTYVLRFCGPQQPAAPVAAATRCAGQEAAAPRAALLPAPSPASRYEALWQQQQVIYDELLASPEWAASGQRPVGEPGPDSLCAHELTRDLAGWAPPQAGALRGGRH